MQVCLSYTYMIQCTCQYDIQYTYHNDDIRHSTCMTVGYTYMYIPICHDTVYTSGISIYRHLQSYIVYATTYSTRIYVYIMLHVLYVAHISVYETHDIYIYIYMSYYRTSDLHTVMYVGVQDVGMTSSTVHHMCLTDSVTWSIHLSIPV